MHYTNLELGRLLDETYLLRRTALRLEETYDDALETQSTFTHDLEQELTANYQQLERFERELKERLGKPEGYDFDLAMLAMHPARSAYLGSLKT